MGSTVWGSPGADAGSARTTPAIVISTTVISATANKRTIQPPGMHIVRFEAERRLNGLQPVTGAALPQSCRDRRPASAAPEHITAQQRNHEQPIAHADGDTGPARHLGIRRDVALDESAHQQ